MICVVESGYTLRQVNGHRVTYVTFPDGDVRKVIGPKLTKQTAPAIILAAGKPRE